MLQDRIADMLTRIRNAGKQDHSRVLVSFSKLNIAIANTLKDEGYIRDFVLQEDGKNFYIFLKYYKGTCVIEKIDRISKPSKRVYTGCLKMPKVCGGFGIAVISTSKGVMSNIQASKLNLGGEVICYVV